MDQQSRPASQKLPAGLAGVLNAPEDNRDSAYFSSTDSKRKLSSPPEERKKERTY
jgi:hypothetical protein